MHAALAVTDDFDKKTKELLRKNNLSIQTFLEFCLYAVDASKSHWKYRWGIAYRVTDAWLTFGMKNTDEQIEKICDSFGRLELPDHLVAHDETGVKERWAEVREMIVKAQSSYGKNN